MPSISSLLTKLSTDFPTISFQPGENFVWSPNHSTVFYPLQATSPALLLHELGHALQGHHDYHRDVQLLAMESDAWQAAKSLSGRYRVAITEAIVQDHLDTYREWLHARSRCPACEATGQQISPTGYSCVACGQGWTVNEARTCQLKRYTSHTKNTPV